MTKGRTSLNGYVVLIGLGILTFGLSIWTSINGNKESDAFKTSLDTANSHLLIANHNLDSLRTDSKSMKVTITNLDNEIAPFLSMARNKFPNGGDSVGLKKLAFTLNQFNSATVQQNNGIINQGGSGNTYNQTVNPASPQRHMSPKFEALLKPVLDNKKFKDFDIATYMNDPEGLKFAYELSEYLEMHGLHHMSNMFQTIWGPPDPSKKKGSVDCDPEGTFLLFTINPL